jgi:hypothetical protein
LINKCSGGPFEKPPGISAEGSRKKVAKSVHYGDPKIKNTEHGIVVSLSRFLRGGCYVLPEMWLYAE